jgi:hypothetical protein
MIKTTSRLLAGLAIALLLSIQASKAGTIIKLDLGGTGPDVSYSGGILSTVNDGNAGTTGDQNTAIVFTDFLSSQVPNPTTGSYSLSGATIAGAPTPLGGGVFAQNFSGGDFQIYNSANALLLQVHLGSSLLVGGGNGAFFSITNGNVTGGSLASQIAPGSVGMSMTLTSISGGGLSLNGNGGLNSFVADATKEITGTQVPEPAAILLMVGGFGVASVSRRRR